MVDIWCNNDSRFELLFYNIWPSSNENVYPMKVIGVVLITIVGIAISLYFYMDEIIRGYFIS